MQAQRPVVFIGDDSPKVQATLQHQLAQDGVDVYLRGVTIDPSSPTSFIGGFKCALLELDRAAGKDDPIDEADLLRVYQPELPIAFMHERASPALLNRAMGLGPVFRKGDELVKAVAWLLENARR